MCARARAHRDPPLILLGIPSRPKRVTLV